jgi:excisionase family DNA binding protein
MEQQVEHMTTSQVAQHFGVDSSTVRRWVIQGKLKPSITTPGGYHRFSPETVNRLAESSAPTN